MIVSILLFELMLRSGLQIQSIDSKTDERLYSAAQRIEDEIRVIPSSELASLAEREFASGMNRSHDAAKARPRFREAARMYDELWQRGIRDPHLALNRAHSHRLAGELPSAIVALNEGLAAARWSRPLQVALEDARSAVAYSSHSDMAALCRPSPSSTIGTRMSPREAQLISAVLWFLVCGGIARFAMTRAGWWLAFAAIWLIVLAGLGALWVYDNLVEGRNAEHPAVVISQAVDLRKGNADGFPLRLDGPGRLPRGVEARELTRRGGWIQIQLASGIIGWVPDAAVLRTGP